MSCYIEGSDEFKEELAKSSGTAGLSWIDPSTVPEDEGVLVLCDNGAFCALAVIYSLKEAKRWHAPYDSRLKVWFTLPREKIYELCPHAEFFYKECGHERA